MQDVRLVIDKYKSGFPIPSDHEFEDLGDPGSPNSGPTASALGGSTAGSNGTPQHVTPNAVRRSQTMNAGGGGGGTQSGGKNKTRKGLFGIFASSKVRT